MARVAIIFALVAVVVIPMEIVQSIPPPSLLPSKSTSPGPKSGSTTPGKPQTKPPWTTPPIFPLKTSPPPKTAPPGQTAPPKTHPTTTGGKPKTSPPPKTAPPGQTAPPKTHPTTTGGKPKTSPPPKTAPPGQTAPPKTHQTPTAPTGRTPSSKPTPTPITMPTRIRTSKLTKPPIHQKTTTPPVSWVTKPLSKTDLQKFDGAFDEGSIVHFSGKSLFDTQSGNVSDDFLNILDSDEKRAIEELQSDWKDVIDLKDIFKNAMPEDVQFFTQQFKNMDKMKLEKMYDSPGTVQAADMKGVPLEIIGALNESVRVDKLSKFPQEAQDELCKKLQNDETDFDTTARIAKGLNCSESLKRSGSLPKGSLARAIASNKMTEKHPKLWSPIEWKDSIKDGWFVGLPDSVIERCPSQIVKENMQDLRKISDGMDSKLKDKVMSKVNEALGGTRHMSASDISNMGDMVKDMKISEMKKLNTSSVRGSLSTLKDNAKDMSRAQKMQVKKSVSESVGGASNWTADDVANAAPFIGSDRNLMKKMDKNVLIASMANISTQDLDPKSARNMVSKIRESTDYDEPKDFDDSKFKTCGNLVKGLPPRFVKNMTNVDFGSLLASGDLKDIDFSDNSKVVVKRVLEDSGKAALDTTDLKNLGKNMKGLRKDDVDNINADDLATALGDMKDTMNEIVDKMDSTTLDSMIKKVEGATGGLGGNLEKMGSLLQKVPIKKLKALSDSDFGDMSGQTERNLNCSKDTCPELFKRVNKTIGQPGIKNPNFTMTVFRNLGKVMCGMSVDDLKMIPATKMLEDIVGHLISLDCLSDKQERILAEKLKYRLGLFSGNPRTISSQDIKKFGKIMKHFDTDDLENLGKSVCGDISQELGSADLANVKKDDLKKLSQYAQKCVNNTVGELSSDDMVAMGDLVCGLSTDRVDDIADNAMEDIVNSVQSKCAQFSISERKTWAEKAMKKLNVTKNKIADADEVTLTQLGTLVAEIDNTDLKRIPDDTMSSIGSDIVDQFKDRKEQIDKRDEKGFGNDVKDTDRKDSNEKEKKVYERLITAFTAPSSRRRKRSVTSLSCDDMQLLGSGVTALTTDQLEAMTDSDFLDCASFLGGQSSWSSNQQASLLTVATRAGTFNTVTGWTADHVTDAGIIAQALTYSEIESLTDLTLDAMYSIGQHEGWSETQLGSGFSRWLDLNKGNDASTITSSELIALGHFACGATTSHIGQMSSAEYSSAATYIGELTSCAESQLEAFADLAETAFGSYLSWDTSVVSTVGVIVGGLTSNEISELTTTQIAAVDPASIAQIPSTSFVGFTVNQILSFSVAQAQSTTATQHSGLSSTQLDALISVGATVESSAVAMQTSVFVLLMAALLSTVNAL